MKAAVTKIFTFDAAHKIPNHSGKCRDLHGHTYTLAVTVHGPVQSKDVDASDFGMVVDFGDLKEVYKNHIEPLVDHKYLNDTLPIQVTTAECIAAWCFEQFKKSGIIPSKVRVWETGSCYAEVNNGDLI